MSYFRELPNISYSSRFSGRNKSEETVEVKNLFKRAKLRSDIDSAITAFSYYKISEGERPDTLAKKIYNDSELDWVILTTNNITNVRDQWPLEGMSFTNYLLSKYGTSDMTEEEKYAELNKVKHYETTQVKDEYDRILLEKGAIVDKDFKFTFTKEVPRNKTISEVTLTLPFTASFNAGDAITQPTANSGGYTFTGGSGTVKTTTSNKTKVIINKVVGNFITTPSGIPAGNPLLLNGVVLTNSGVSGNPVGVSIRYKTNTTAVTVNPVKGVSHYEYEVDMNEKKRRIKVLKPEYLSVFISDMRNIMKYSRSSQYVNQRIKKTYNPDSVGV
tara:strand:+ start:480 stop:1469 length:990 start_codon:yes stop_codon:yes gene_type:complete